MTIILPLIFFTHLACLSPLSMNLKSARLMPDLSSPHLPLMHPVDLQFCHKGYLL
jgi:hypothetical protein